MLKPNSSFRANPDRAIFVQGRIDQQLIDRLTPEIVALQAKSREPITVYIDSPGGSTASQEAIAQFLRASDQDYSAGCEIITVVTGRAASAAADLLCSGNYAIAHAESTVFFHGVISLFDNPINVAAASEIIETLRATNDRYAMALADKSIFRLGFRYVIERDNFEEHRQQIGKPLTDLQCFIGLISKRLSRSAMKVVERALERNARYESLVTRVGRAVRRSQRFNNAKRTADAESAIIKGVVDFELSRNNDPNWTFRDGGLRQLNNDFLLVVEYLNIYESHHLKRLCDRFGDLLLNAEDKRELNQIQDEAQHKARRDEKLKPALRPLWLFCVSLCFALQEGENDLSATDVFWLGLIDEVIGGPTDLFPIRLMLEFVDDTPVADPIPTEPEPVPAVESPASQIQQPSSA